MMNIHDYARAMVAASKTPMEVHDAMRLLAKRSHEKRARNRAEKFNAARAAQTKKYWWQEK